MSLSARVLAKSPTLNQQVSQPDRTLRKSAELFAERGFAQVGMRELARHLGISSGSIYHHIESKQALLGELLEDLYQTLLAGPLGTRVLPQRSAQERLQDTLSWHLLLHKQKTEQFLLAERDTHYLEDRYRNPIDALRNEYRDYLANQIAAASGHTLSPIIHTLSSSLISALNSIPTWLPREMEQNRKHRVALSLVTGMIHTSLYS
ncbi:TPA: TetR/AcrR family transcriptional regulator [Pseudomonas aeruginosa]|uniref:TetR/AcrR family transcriptional regulator n=1 Tax=Pseudomonas aeruginosa TaxID=287 RepID=UPI0003B975BC|nr:TetR/AcrR family transcriptional regulator [Pseudomonas aeruginosa]EKT9494454.1 TetR/AcrR family transcriptional regulator [Pseudomonas aeruginosa]ERY35648.1 hypothetical protein Q067_02283 [Pseudomonas aeruginosa BL13]MBH4028499.1 TetR/AcrR family transcriptional regulator [Pseudomonas aeruginosa]MBV5530531.1 TetR/AcrR family transcriptional regulator [Pseudomonas aeruginosa]MCS8095424.1 TetR/AcrR family transcriptional regulator [Pseudomonas aeruginosa]